MNTYIPEGYKSLLGVYDTQKAIGLLKRLFEDQLAAKLNLFRVSAPLFLEEASGLNDNLNGYERPVLFDIPQAGKEAQVVQSLAKWKRMALYRYDIHPGKGIYTDMNAIRRDEELDNLHSVYVDQWDWEKVITPETRTLFTLHQAVTGIVSCICCTRAAAAAWPALALAARRLAAKLCFSRSASWRFKISACFARFLARSVFCFSFRWSACRPRRPSVRLVCWAVNAIFSSSGVSSSAGLPV